MTETILIILSGSLLLHYLWFLLDVYSGLSRLKSRPTAKPIDEFISVIVPFRNESENIISSLKSLTGQDYPEERYEIIYIDDFSTDDSAEKLKSNSNSQNVRIISVPDDYSLNAHKKRAVRFGIENAKGSLIVTTDADCTHQPGWLKAMTGRFEAGTGFVSGPVEFTGDNSVFGRLQKLEFAGLVITGAGLIGAGKPTICNAANTAYRKEAYEQAGGFSDQMNLSSGDDELLMQKISKDTDYSVEFAADTEAIVSTIPNRSVSEFYQQRKRWASKGLFYRDRNLITKLILIYLYYISLPFQLAAGFILWPGFYLSFIISFLVKMTIEYMVIRKGSRLVNSGLAAHIFILAQLLHVPYIITAGIAGALGDFTWKSRTVSR